MGEGLGGLQRSGGYPEPRLRGKGTRAAPSDVNTIQDEGCGTASV